MIQISVVVPTYNSKEELKKCLAVLTKQTFSADKYEVIIVDDGSTDGTEEAVEEIKKDLKKSMQRNLKYFKQENSGPAVARNLGIQKAEGEIIAFTDSDCIARPNWLEEIDKSFQDAQILGVSGQTISLDVLVFPWRIAPAGFGFTTCNMAYKESALADAGGFDEKFGVPYYEDTDLALRLKKNGGNIIQNKQAIVVHPPRVLGVKGLAKQAFLHRYDSLFSRLYPGYVNDFGAPFKPIFWRFSLVGLGSLLLSVFLIGGLFLLGIKALLFLALFLGVLFIFFLAGGYRLCLSCWPGNLENEKGISLYEKTKTFVALLVYIPLFLMARIISLLKYRKFLF